MSVKLASFRRSERDAPGAPNPWKHEILHPHHPHSDREGASRCPCTFSALQLLQGQVVMRQGSHYLALRTSLPWWGGGIAVDAADGRCVVVLVDAAILLTFFVVFPSFVLLVVMVFVSRHGICHVICGGTRRNLW